MNFQQRSMSVVSKIHSFCFLPNLGEKSFVLETVKHTALRTEGAPCTSNRRVAGEGEMLSTVSRGSLTSAVEKWPRVSGALGLHRGDQQRRQGPPGGWPHVSGWGPGAGGDGASGGQSP